MNFRYEIIDEYGNNINYYHGWNLNAAKYYVDTHNNCSIRDRKTSKIIYSKIKTKGDIQCQTQSKTKLTKCLKTCFTKFLQMLVQVRNK